MNISSSEVGQPPVKGGCFFVFYPRISQFIMMAIGKAYFRKEELEKTGFSILRFAECEGVCERQVRKLLPLVSLSPMVLKQALTGDLARYLTLDDLLHAGLGLDWNRQAKELGMP